MSIAEKIVSIVIDLTGAGEEFYGNSRRHNLVMSRFIATQILRELTTYGINDIAIVMRQPATKINNYFYAFGNKLKYDKQFALNYEIILRKCKTVIEREEL